MVLTEDKFLGVAFGEPWDAVNSVVKNVSF